MGGGGASSSSDNTVTFNDTSEYMFRNSSTKKGGFEGSISRVTGSSDLDTLGSEDITRTSDSLTAPDRDLLRSQMSEILACVGPSFCADKATLEQKAGVAWNRAIALLPAMNTAMQTQLADLKQEAIERICLRRNQWARTAGSSLNCLVQGLEARAEVDLTRKLAGLIAERYPEMTQIETAAIERAFNHEFQARAEMARISFTHVANLWQILRGAQVIDVTDRAYMEERDEATTQNNSIFRVYHEGVDIADKDGTYASVVDDAVSTSQGLAGLLGAIL